MTDGQLDIRPVLMVLVIVAIVLATAQAALAKPHVDQDLTVVSSTVLGENTFTMTAWNMSIESVEVTLEHARDSLRRFGGHRDLRR